MIQPETGSIEGRFGKATVENCGDSLVLEANCHHQERPERKIRARFDIDNKDIPHWIKGFSLEDTKELYLHRGKDVFKFARMGNLTVLMSWNTDWPQNVLSAQFDQRQVGKLKHFLSQ